jgi:hypothetical protein
MSRNAAGAKLAVGRKLRSHPSCSTNGVATKPGIGRGGDRRDLVGRVPTSVQSGDNQALVRFARQVFTGVMEAVEFSANIKQIDIAGIGCAICGGSLGHGPDSVAQGQAGRYFRQPPPGRFRQPPPGRFRQDAVPARCALAGDNYDEQQPQGLLDSPRT